MQTSKTSQAKERILGRIRQGLSKAQLPQPFPEVIHEPDSKVFEPKRVSAEEAFAEEFIKLGGRFIFCANEQELLEGINVLYDNKGWGEIFCSDPVLTSLFQNNKLNFVKAADPGDGTADACITLCEALVGRTGSVIFSSRQQFGRTAPVYYPVHIIVAYAGQAVEDISDGIALMKSKYGEALPSMINLNTGPSRTADIEKTLVVGVHGPGEVFCFYVNA